MQLCRGVHRTNVCRRGQGRPFHPRRCTVVRVAEKQAEKAPQGEAGIADFAMEAIKNDPETAASVERLQAALARVDAAKAAADELEKQYKDALQEALMSDKAQERMQEQAMKEIMAAAEVAAAEKLLAAAELEMARAEMQQKELTQTLVQDAEKSESGKAAAIAAGAGFLALAPLLALGPGTLNTSTALSALAALASCLLFGVTYRYAVRQDASNTQLKGGVVAAFGLVRAAAAGDVLQTKALEPFSIEDVIGPAALYAAESMLLFGFAAAAIEFAFQRGLLKPFGQATVEIISGKPPSK